MSLQGSQSKYMAVLRPIAELLEKKNADYGCSYERLRDEFGSAGFHIFLTNKLLRIKQVDAHGAQVTTESAIDTIQDIIGYCALELCYRAKLDSEVEAKIYIRTKGVAP